MRGSEFERWESHDETQCPPMYNSQLGENEGKGLGVRRSGHLDRGRRSKGVGDSRSVAFPPRDFSTAFDCLGWPSPFHAFASKVVLHTPYSVHKSSTNGGMAAVTADLVSERTE